MISVQKIKQRFDEEGIGIPFPHRTLYAGSEAPFPVHVVAAPNVGENSEERALAPTAPESTG